MDYKDAVAAFLISRQAADRSSKTVDWYRIMLERFRLWLITEGLSTDVSLITPEHIDQFLAAERASGLKRRTVQGRYRALSAFFGWLVQRERHRAVAGKRAPALTESPLDAVDRPPSPKHEPRRAELADLAALVESIQPANWVDLRDRLVIRMLFWTGLRVGELLNLDVLDVDIREEVIHVREKEGGPGAESRLKSKDRIVPLHPSLRAQVVEYLLNRPARPGETALFLGSTGDGGSRERFGVSGLRKMLKRRAKAAGIPYWNPHAYRHSMAMKLLNDGAVELGIVSKILGHSSPEITRRIYADFVDTSIKRAYAAAIDRLSDAL